MAAMPIYGEKAFKRHIFQNLWADPADILQEAWAPPYIK